MQIKYKYLPILYIFFGGIIMTALACGGYFYENGEPDYSNYFVPKTLNNPSLNPFNFITYQELYKDSNIENEDSLNILLWNQYTKNTTYKDAKYFIYKTSYKQLSNLYYHIEKKQALTLSTSLKNNTLTKYFIQSKDLEALGYLMYAKQCEVHCALPVDYWGIPEHDTLKMDKLIKNGKQLLAVSKKDFIRQRYVYQLLRLAHYKENYNQVLALSDSLNYTSFEKNIIYQKSHALHAGALRKIGQLELSAYEFAQIYQNCLALKTMAYRNFKYIDDFSIKKLLSLAKNKEEKALLWALMGMENFYPSEAYLDKVYAENPTSPELELMLLREINKAEHFYFTNTVLEERHKDNIGYEPYYFNYKGWEDTSSQIVLKNFYLKATTQLSVLVHAIAERKDTKSPALWYIADAYISTMLNDTLQARNALLNTNLLKLNTPLAYQLDITKILFALKTNKTIDANFEAEILPSLQHLDDITKKDNDYLHTKNKIWDNIISEKYRKENKPFSVILALDKSGVSPINFIDNKATPNDLINLQNILNSTNKTPFETYISSTFTIKDDLLTEWIGTKYMREHDFVNAYKYLSKLSDTYYQKSSLSANIIADPLAVNTQDYRNVIYKSSAKKLNKKNFAKIMIQLQQQIQTQPNDFKTNFDFATALYNISYYGNNCYQLTDYRSSTEWGNYNIGMNNFQKEYYGVMKAEYYYKKAYECTLDKETKAKCLFLAAKCEQKRIFNFGNEEWSYDMFFKYNKHMRQSINFKALSAYKNTNFYQKIYNECSYLRDFEDQY